MEPSGADKGFFQTPPTLPNQFYDDASLQRCFKRTTFPRPALNLKLLTSYSFPPRQRYFKNKGRSSFLGPGCLD
jgi:hypothetical protein